MFLRLLFLSVLLAPVASAQPATAAFANFVNEMLATVGPASADGFESLHGEFNMANAGDTLWTSTYQPSGAAGETFYSLVDRKTNGSATHITRAKMTDGTLGRLALKELMAQAIPLFDAHFAGWTSMGSLLPPGHPGQQAFWAECPFVDGRPAGGRFAIIEYKPNDAGAILDLDVIYTGTPTCATP